MADTDTGARAVAVGPAVAASLAASAVWGVLLQATGRMDRLAALTGGQGTGAAWVALLALGVVGGLGYAYLARGRRGGVLLGLMYGVALWLTAVVARPVVVGAAAPAAAVVPSLLGYLLYGGLLGALYPVFAPRDGAGGAAGGEVSGGNGS